jgi:hypothetical protein
VSFTGNGNFSDVANCSGGNPGCSISPDGNVLKMSGASNYQNKPSTLTITDITGTNVTTNKNDYVIGKITWVNLPIAASVAGTLSRRPDLTRPKAISKAAP